MDNFIIKTKTSKKSTNERKREEDPRLSEDSLECF